MNKGSWFLFTGVATFCVIFYLVAMLPQDVMFSKYKKAFKQIQHPTGTYFVKAYSSFGALDKMRIMYKDDFPQGCDYRVSEVREYSSIQESIRTFYSDKVVIVNGQKSPIGIIFIPIDSNRQIDPDGLTRDQIIEWGPGVFRILEELKEDQNFGFLRFKPLATYYFISSGGFSLSNFDFRCLF